MWIFEPKGGPVPLASKIYTSPIQFQHTFNAKTRTAFVIIKGADGGRMSYGLNWQAGQGAIIEALVPVNSTVFPSTRIVDFEIGGSPGYRNGVGGFWTGGNAGSGSPAPQCGGGAASFMFRNSDDHPLIVAGGGAGSGFWYGSDNGGGKAGIESTSWLGETAGGPAGNATTFTGGTGTNLSSSSASDGAGGGGGGGGGPSGSGRSPGAGGTTPDPATGGGGGDSWIDEALLTHIASYWAYDPPSGPISTYPSHGHLFLWEFAEELDATAINEWKAVNAAA